MKWFQEQALQGTSCVSKDVIATTQMFLMWAGKRFSQLANSHSVNILVWYSVILENNLIQVESSWVDSRWVGTSGKEVHLSSKPKNWLCYPWQWELQCKPFVMTCKCIRTLSCCMGYTAGSCTSVSEYYMI